MVHPTGGGGGSVGEVAYFVTNIADVIVTDSNGDMVETKAVYIADGGEEKELVVRPESVKYVFDEKQVKIGDAIRYGESSGYLVSVDKPIAWQDTVDAEGNPLTSLTGPWEMITTMTTGSYTARWMKSSTTSLDP